MIVTLDIPDDFDKNGFFDIDIAIGKEKWTARSAIDFYMMYNYRGDRKKVKHDYKFGALYEAMQVIQKRIEQNDNS